MGNREFWRILFVYFVILSMSVHFVCAQNIDAKDIDQKQEKTLEGLKDLRRDLDLRTADMDARFLDIREIRDQKQNLMSQQEIQSHGQDSRVMDSASTKKDFLENMKSYSEDIQNNLRMRMEQTKQQMQDMRNAVREAQARAKRNRQESSERMRDAKSRYEDQKRQQEMMLENFRNR